MKNTNTRRGFTQMIVGNGTSYPSPLEGEDARRTKEGECHQPFSPLPAVGHPLPQGARKTTWGFTLRRHAELVSASSRFIGGFTLIEVLVVVLIIAVLTAVAVPMYKRAVLKSRFSTLMPMASSLAKSNEVYYLNNGEYADALSKLDVENPPEQTAGVLAGLKSTEYYNYVLITREGLNNNYIIYQAHSKNFPDNIHCEAKTDDENANNVCKSLDGVKVGGGQTENYTTYILRGSAGDGHFPTTYNGDNDITLAAVDTCKTTAQQTCKYNIYDGGSCISTHSNSCREGEFKNGATCEAGGGSGSCTATYNNSTCKGTTDHACGGGTFRNESECTAKNYGCDGSSFANSKCVADGTYACTAGSFTNSECVGNGANSCGHRPTLPQTSSFNNSTCFGNNDNACSDSSYTNNSKCMMNYSTACANNKYSTGAGCQASGEFACPVGTPKTDSWDAENNTYTSDGWNGGCCNPNYMVGGTCPAGATVCE